MPQQLFSRELRNLQHTRARHDLFSRLGQHVLAGLTQGVLHCYHQLHIARGQILLQPTFPQPDEQGQSVKELPYRSTTLSTAVVVTLFSVFR